MADKNGNTALWDAVASKHYTIFKILYQLADLSDPHTAGELLCMAARRNDLTVMNELLNQGLDIDSKDSNGSTAIQVAMAENHVDMVQLLVMNGADVAGIDTDEFSALILNEMLRKREIGHRITVHESIPGELPVRGHEGEKEQNCGRCNGQNCPRVNIFRGHPIVRREKRSMEAGKLIKLPNSLEELKTVAGDKFG